MMRTSSLTVVVVSMLFVSFTAPRAEIATWLLVSSLTSWLRRLVSELPVAP